MEWPEKVTSEISSQKTAAASSVSLEKWCPEDTTGPKALRRNSALENLMVKQPTARKWRENLVS